MKLKIGKIRMLEDYINIFVIVLSLILGAIAYYIIVKEATHTQKPSVL